MTCPSHAPEPASLCGGRPVSCSVLARGDSWSAGQSGLPCGNPGASRRGASAADNQAGACDAPDQGEAPADSGNPRDVRCEERQKAAEGARPKRDRSGDHQQVRDHRKQDVEHPHPRARRTAVRIPLPATQPSQRGGDADDLKSGDQQQATQRPREDPKPARAGLGAGEQGAHACPDVTQRGGHHEMIGVEEEDEALVLLRQDRHVGEEAKKSGTTPSCQTTRVEPRSSMNQPMP